MLFRSTNRLLLILLSGFFAFVVACLAGFLVDRERRHREQSEKNRYLAGIGRVATTIVHDLKNPLLTILGFTKRIRDGKGNMDNALQAITDSARNMQRIVNDVLDFAKPIRLTFKEEDVRGIINRACVFCKTTAERQRSEEHTSELQSHSFISYAVFCLKKKKKRKNIDRKAHV